MSTSSILRSCVSVTSYSVWYRSSSFTSFFTAPYLNGCELRRDLIAKFRALGFILEIALFTARYVCNRSTHTVFLMLAARTLSVGELYNAPLCASQSVIC